MRILLRKRRRCFQIHFHLNRKYDIKQSFTFRIDCFFVLFDAKLEIKNLKKWYSKRQNQFNRKLIKPETPVKSRVSKILLKKLALEG